jgi:hypothetical protein
MIIYVNGDSHSAGAELVKDYCFAADDPKYTAWQRRPHPDAIPHTYGFKLARALNAGFFLDAESASSNDRILRTTREYADALTTNIHDRVFIIGWSTWEREEWLQGDETYIQVTASGTDSVPPEFGDRYKQWVIDQTPEVVKEKCQQWHDKIWEFHQHLNKLGIRHIFFNSYSHFDVDEQRDWGDSYVSPYDKSGTYYQWLADQGFLTVRYGSYHYGIDAHSAWYKFLLPRLTSGVSTSIMSNTKVVKRTVKPSSGLMRKK